MKYLISTMIIIFLSGCGASVYKPHGFGGGYTNIQYNKNTFKVSFRGNGLTPKSRVDTYLLYRCAEITTLNGDDYFVITNSGSTILRDTISMPGHYTGTTYVDKYGTGYSSGTYTPGHTDTIRNYYEEVMIKTFKGKISESKLNGYDAKELMSYLENQIER